MRLLRTSTIEVEEFIGREIPEYVILSHTWQEEECTLQDVQSGAAKGKKGYTKIVKCCEKAAEDGYSYCWVDTCCIDKTSSAELSEAINSMYQYYKNARICYAYLADFDAAFDSLSVMEDYRGFTKSRWWTRGWTLQELIAPPIVEFYTANWVEIGTKLSLQEQITEITGIDEGVLRDVDPLRRNVAVRMSWAAHRVTSRIEDRAYCLMGIFGVNMPLLYGEGNRAFSRLQEEILKVREDYSLFAWSPVLFSSPMNPQKVSKGMLADSPSDFVDSRDHWTNRSLSKSANSQWSFRDLSKNCSSLLTPSKDHEPPYLTSRGLRISLPVVERQNRQVNACITLLRPENHEKMMLCMTLHRLGPKSEQYIRRIGADLTLSPISSSGSFKYRSIYVIQPPVRSDIPRPISSPSGAPSLLLVKMKVIPGDHLVCHWSSWINMESVLRARFGTSSSDSSLADSASGVSKQGGGVYKHRLNKIVDATMHFNCEDILKFAFNNPPELCWFSDADKSRSHLTTGVRGILCFGEREHPHSSFLIQIGLFDDRPLCNVLQNFPKPPEGETLAPTEEMSSSLILGTLSRDRVIFHGKRSEADHPDLPDIETTVSIRRMATSSEGIQRFMLSITQKSVPFQPASQRRVPTIGSVDSWEDLTSGTTSALDSMFLGR
ncbi:HET-domain-containing protein [Aaosphaeria arxii CBS 175.79]|uniref:HET-domain-containing protein n=1 Tax=Aaosphaeria arxii CBS 175.79 TaxID=1450172 RepID=A0A6A5X985_9PLEO|nr:HET-domain-containing protein [Aaosphaeria arxii CBS 175.79]KAF2009503.1 HET-domain-containing protein [Aaosphaeria arxii CBS 175.79]